MPVTIKSAQEIELMREAGRILASVHQELGKAIKPGMSTFDVDRLGEEMIRSYGCEPSFLNYCGYPASICVSVNEEVVHGIPSAERILQEGDIVSLDAGVIYKGYHSDAARTVGVGEISKEAQYLIERTRLSFFQGMKYAAAGKHLFEISNAISSNEMLIISPAVYSALISYVPGTAFSLILKFSVARVPEAVEMFSKPPAS